MLKVEVFGDVSTVVDSVTPALRNCGLRGELKYSGSSDSFKLSSKSTGLNLSNLAEELKLLNWSLPGARIQVLFDQEYAPDVLPVEMLALLEDQDSYTCTLKYGVVHNFSGLRAPALEVRVSIPSRSIDGVVRCKDWSVSRGSTSSFEAQVAFGIPTDIDSAIKWFSDRVGVSGVTRSSGGLVSFISLKDNPDSSVFCLADVCGVSLAADLSASGGFSTVRVTTPPYGNSVVFTAKYVM